MTAESETSIICCDLISGITAAGNLCRNLIELVRKTICDLKVVIKIRTVPPFDAVRDNCRHL